MKNKISVVSHIVMFCVALLPLGLCPLRSQASPYASCITITNGTVYFYLNESGGNVTVTYEDGTTNATFDGVSSTATNLAKGQHSFDLNGHTGYAIAVSKVGNGVPYQISSDSDDYSQWNSPRGVGINKNPKYGPLFGRIYAGNSTPGTRGRGLYALNPDFSLAIGLSGTGSFYSSSSYSPIHLRVAPDNSVVVDDWNGGTGNGQMLMFSSDLTSSEVIFGSSAALSINIHGDMWGTPQVFGSLATSNLVVWIADSGMGVPSQDVDPDIQLGHGTERGMFNNIYRYDIGAGPLPWTKPPNYAFNYGLPTIGELVVDSDVAPDGKIFTGFGRSNLSNPNINVLDPTGLQVPLWNSWVNSGGNSDPFRGDTIGTTVEYPYGGVRVSPDDQYFASMGIDNAFIVAKLTNGIPDLGALFVVTNSPNVGNARGMDWDIADNIYGISSGQGLLREFSLGNTATCITSNDVTLTNGTFILLAPPIAASAVATVPYASQNYGSPTPGVITISLNTNVLTEPVTVAYTRSGTAAYPDNYTLNLGTNLDGVVITPTNVVFPAGTWLHKDNWAADVDLTPTPVPASGPALTANFQILGGANYVVANSGGKASVVIANTGPQLLLLSPVGNTFSRSTPNDYVEFKITRWGDVSVPDYTVTNINYSGTASFPGDFTAGAQNFSGSLLSDGSPGITIRSGEVDITNAIGNPVSHAGLNIAPMNATIVLTLTNLNGSTNVSAANGYVYVVSPTNSITLTELDNAAGGNGNGGGVTLWSDTLNDADTSTNWTLTFASEQFRGTPSTFSYTTNYSYVTNGAVITTNIDSITTNVTSYVSSLPAVVPDYTNGETSAYYDSVNGTNDFDVQFGYPLPNDIPPSAAMAANGWTNVLRMTVNKSQGYPAAVNLYPTDKQFYGNYALKFSMYLSLWPDAIGAGIYGGYIPLEYALCGINHYGTNCNWRPAVAVTPTNNVSGVINSDGIWLALDASDNAATPADFDVFLPPAVPNPGMNGYANPQSSDLASDAGSSHRNDFKNPPFTETENVLGGEPVRKWVDVSVETTDQTNVVFKVNGSPVGTVYYTGYGKGHTVWLASNNVPNTPYTSGDIMLGYLDPDASVGDASSQFVYYSDVRVVELSPYISAHPTPGGVIVTNGASASFTASATYATAPLTGTWYQAANATTPTLAVQTNTAAATNLTTTLTLTDLQAGTNYAVVFSDAAGSITSALAQVEVITGPANQTANAGDNVQFTVVPDGPAAPTSYQWQTNGVSLTNNDHYAGATTATLTINDVQPSDATVYSVVVANAAGSVTPSAMLTVGASQAPVFSGVELVGTNAVLTFTSPNGADTTSSYTLQSSPQVQGPYVDTPGTITGSAGAFQFTVPLTTNNAMFYRLKHN